MPDTVIKIENLSKLYHLGMVGTGTMAHDLNRWWKMNIQGQTDPYAKVGETNDGAHKGKSEYVWALKDISFSVKRGEVLGIIGRNGAGKSTLLKILSKVTTPTTGNIKIKGRIASLLEVGTGFHPELTGRENVYMNGTIMGMKKREIDSKFDEIVDFAGVERYIDTPVKRYSSGMYVRLAFAIAAYLEPEVLIFDEVLAVGDSEFQKKALGKMKDVSEGEGRTVLFVSHNITAIMSLCNRAIVLDKGNLVFSGRVQQAIESYYSTFKGSLQLNFKNRKGSQKAKVINIKLINSEGKETNRIKFQETFQIQLEIEGHLKRAILGILFGDFSILQICRAYSPESFKDTINIDGFLRTTCVFNELPLVPGKYFIHTWLGLTSEVVDFVENIFEFEIIDIDYFKTGKKLDASVPCFVKHSWIIDK